MQAFCFLFSCMQGKEIFYRWWHRTCLQQEIRERDACVLDPMIGRHKVLQQRGRLCSEGVSHHCGKSLLLLSSSKKSLMSGQQVRQVKTSWGRRNMEALCPYCAKGRDQGRKAHTLQWDLPGGWVQGLLLMTGGGCSAVLSVERQPKSPNPGSSGTAF